MKIPDEFKSLIQFVVIADNLWVESSIFSVVPKVDTICQEV